jgi:CubicO group peptidase (beta-lactamase class C family)
VSGGGASAGGQSLGGPSGGGSSAGGSVGGSSVGGGIGGRNGGGIGGSNDPRIEKALQTALDAGELGLQVAAYLGDDLIVDAWAGTDGRGSPVRADTLFPVFSVTKAVTATLVHLFAQRGRLDLDGPVAAAWPGYAQHGKGEITFDHVLSHRSGAPTISRQTTVAQLCDWDTMTRDVAAQVPVAPPGTVNSYSPFAFGWVLGEPVRRVDPGRRSFHQALREDLLSPLGMDDFYLGLPPAEMSRVARLVGDDAPVLGPDSLNVRASPPQLPFGPTLFNRPEVQAAGLPSAGGIATARAVARLFSVYAQDGLLDGRPFLEPDTLRRCRTPRPPTVDETYGYVMPVGHGGLWQIAPGVSDATPGGALTTGVLSHTGAGGTVAWAEPARGLSVAIVHNRTFFGPQPRLPFGAIGDAIHAVADELR